MIYELIAHCQTTQPQRSSRFGCGKLGVRTTLAQPPDFPVDGAQLCISITHMAAVSADTEAFDTFCMPSIDPGNVISFDFHGTYFLQRDRRAMRSKRVDFCENSFSCVVYPFCACRSDLLEEEYHLCTYMSVDIRNTTNEISHPDDSDGMGRVSFEDDFVFECSVLHPDESSQTCLTRVESSSRDDGTERYAGEGRMERAPTWTHFADRPDLRKEGLIREDGSIFLRVKIIREHDAVRVVPSPLGRGSFLRLLENPSQSYSDVKLCGSEENATIIQAHKCVLSTVSAVFSNLLSTSFKESRQEVIRLEDVSSRGLGVIVRHLYGENLPESLYADIRLLVDVWRFSTVSLLTHTITDAENVLSAFLASQHDRDDPSGSLPADVFCEILMVAILLESQNILSELAWLLYHDVVNCSSARSVAQLAEEHPRVAKVVGMEYHDFSALVAKLPVCLPSFHLIECWIDSKEGRLLSAEALFSSFAIEDLPFPELLSTERYLSTNSLAARYAPRRSLSAVAQKLAFLCRAP